MNEIIKSGVSAPSKERLLDEANLLPAKVPYLSLYEYGDVIHVLRNDKGFSWREVQFWFEERNMNFTTSHFSNAYEKWKCLNGVVD